ncbi:MAG: hypothetical protein ACLTDR_15020 [Adlercreutzia equolifaciens]
MRPRQGQRKAAPLWARRSTRAFSCDAHSLGLRLRLRASPRSAAGVSPSLVGDGAFWVVFFVAVFVDVLAFYWCLAEPRGLSPWWRCSSSGAAAGAWFFVALSQVAWAVGTRLFMTTIVTAIGCTTLVVQGLFSMLEATVARWSSSCCTWPCAGGGFLSGAGHGSRFVLPRRLRCRRLRSHPHRTRWREDGRGGRRTEVRRRRHSVDDAAGARESTGPNRAVPLCARLFGHRFGVYGAWCSASTTSSPWRWPLGVVGAVASFRVGAGGGSPCPPSRCATAAAWTPRSFGTAFTVSLRVPCRLRGGAPLSRLTNSSELLPAPHHAGLRPLLLRRVACRGLLGDQPDH